MQGINARLEVLRYQTRLLHDFRLIAVNRYEFAAQSTHDIGVELGGWIRQQGRLSQSSSDHQDDTRSRRYTNDNADTC